MATEKREILILWCLVVSVNHIKGVYARIEKYPVKQTDLNFVPVKYPEYDAFMAAHGFEAYKDGFHGPLRERIPVANLLKIDESSRFDSTESIRREIYFLEPDLETARKSMTKCIEKTLGEMKTHMDAMHNFWINRNNK